MTRAEAYQIAVSRGYKGVLSNLQRDIAAPVGVRLGLGMVPVDEREYGATAKNFVDVEKVEP